MAYDYDIEKIGLKRELYEIELTMLMKAAQHDTGLLVPPVPLEQRHRLGIHHMLREALLEEKPAGRFDPHWRDDGLLGRRCLQITDKGRRALNLE